MGKMTSSYIFGPCIFSNMKALVQFSNLFQSNGENDAELLFSPLTFSKWQFQPIFRKVCNFKGWWTVLNSLTHIFFLWTENYGFHQVLAVRKVVFRDNVKFSRLFRILYFIVNIILSRGSLVNFYPFKIILMTIWRLYNHVFDYKSGENLVWPFEIRFVTFQSWRFLIKLVVELWR